MGGMATDGDSTESEAPVDRKRDVRLVGLGVTTVALVWFALGNLRSVSIDFWVTHSRAPLILVIVISGLLGALIATMALRRRSSRS
jgi:uncharacterized integral membrane protein